MISDYLEDAEADAFIFVRDEGLIPKECGSFESFLKDRWTFPDDLVKDLEESHRLKFSSHKTAKTVWWSLSESDRQKFLNPQLS